MLFRSEILSKFEAVTVNYGLDSISSIIMMANADALILSKSSFSFLGGILNREGLVFYQDFWHKPLSRWVQVFQDMKYRETKTS